MYEYMLRCTTQGQPRRTGVCDGVAPMDLHTCMWVERLMWRAGGRGQPAVLGETDGAARHMVPADVRG